MSHNKATKINTAPEIQILIHENTMPITYKMGDILPFKSFPIALAKIESGPCTLIIYCLKNVKLHISQILQLLSIKLALSILIWEELTLLLP
jgi:hypothetical protein